MGGLSSKAGRVSQEVASLRTLVKQAKDAAKNDPSSALMRLRGALKGRPGPTEFQSEEEKAWGDAWELLAELLNAGRREWEALQAYAKVPWTRAAGPELRLFRRVALEFLEDGKLKTDPEFLPVLHEHLLSREVLRQALTAPEAQLRPLKGEMRYRFTGSVQASKGECCLDIVVRLDQATLALEGGCLAPLEAWPQLRSAVVQAALYEFVSASVALSRAAFLCHQAGLEGLAMALVEKALYYESNNKIAQASRAALEEKGVQSSPGAEAMLSYILQDLEPNLARQHRPVRFPSADYKPPAFEPSASPRRALALPRLVADRPRNCREKVGGLPLGLSVDLWPFCASSKRPMNFVLQFDHHPGWLDLGRDRSVLVFVAHTLGPDSATFESGDHKVLLVERKELGTELTQPPPGGVRIYPEAWVEGWDTYQNPVPPFLEKKFLEEKTWSQVEDSPEWGVPANRRRQLLDELSSRGRMGGPPCWLGRPSLPEGKFRFAGQFQQSWPLHHPRPGVDGQRYLLEGPDFAGGIAYLFLPEERSVSEGRLTWQA